MLLELDNVMRTTEDVMAKIDQLDFLPDIPVADWIDKLEQAALNETILDQHCDY